MGGEVQLCVWFVWCSVWFLFALFQGFGKSEVQGGKYAETPITQGYFEVFWGRKLVAGAGFEHAAFRL